MLKKFRKLLLALVLTLGTSSASATSQCPVKQGCLDEVSAWQLVMYEMYANYCPSKPPLSAAEKEKRLRKEYEGDTRLGYVDRLRATKHYLEIHEKLAEQVLRTEDREKKLAQLCREVKID